jgi:hypothetical protein
MRLELVPLESVSGKENRQRGLKTHAGQRQICLLTLLTTCASGVAGRFEVKTSDALVLDRQREELLERLEAYPEDCSRPMRRGENVGYEMSHRGRAIA